MLLYKITYKQEVTSVLYDYEYSEITEWVGSGKEAGQIRKSARQKTGYVPNSVKTDKINVPTNKQGLIDFLNKN